MSVGLRTGQYLYQPEESSHDLGNPLHSEFGWHEVAKGLSRILFGYFLMVSGWAAGGAALYYAIYNHEMAAGDKVSKQSASLIVFFGFGFLGLASLISFGFIVAGKWRCVMNAPERYAAKWLMFLCLFCLLMSPVLHFAFSMSGQGAENYQQIRQHGKQGLATINMEGLSGIMQLISTGLGLASTLFFILFLRAAACCFQSKGCIWMIHLYLVFSCLLIGISVQIVLNAPRLLVRPEVLLSIGVGWLVAVAWYVLIILSVRRTIVSGVSQIRPPLGASGIYR
jgi:hypothetical protein